MSVMCVLKSVSDHTAVDEFVPASNVSGVPVTRFEDKGATSQLQVRTLLGPDWRNHVGPVEVLDNRMWRLARSTVGSWMPNTMAVLGILRKPPLLPGTTLAMRNALAGYHGSNPLSLSDEKTHDKRTGKFRPVTHIGLWSKPGRKRKGRPSGYPWVTVETTKQTDATNKKLVEICDILKRQINPHIMNTLRVEDPQLWWRMKM